MTDIKIYDVRAFQGDSAFLIDDGKTTVLYDTGFGFSGKAVTQNIKNILGERKLDYIFLTHSHYDHALGSTFVKDAYPEAKTVAGSYAASIFARPGARAVMRDMDCKAAARYGTEICADNTDKLTADITVEDGDTVCAGDMCFRVLNLPGHTKCSVAFYSEERKLLLGCETLGVYNGKSTVIPSMLVGYACTLNSIERVRSLEISNILAPHMGLLTKEQTRYFLENMRPAAEAAAQLIKDCIEKGLSGEDIYKRYSASYSDSFTDEAYPEDAARLNTSIMIELIRKEFGLTGEAQ